MGKHVALLRAINVGGRNKVPMAQLKALFADAGCTNVVTYINSGNVIYDAPAALAKRLPALLETAFTDAFGFTAPIVFRTAAQVAETIEHNPFRGREDALFVMFLADQPKAVKALDPDRSPGDTYTVVGRDIYMHLGNGAAATKLTPDYFERALGTRATARNWRTVQKLRELSDHTRVL